MLGQRPTEASPAVGQPLFTTTHWSVIFAAANAKTPQASSALEQLCSTYWYPLYAYVRHRGHSPEDAQDLTQEFFYRLLKSSSLAQVSPAKGKFRSFLIAALNHFLANEWERARTIKRGGGLSFIPLDETLAERLYQSEQKIGRSPEQVFEWCWTVTFLKQVLTRLRDETVAAGHGAHFQELKVYLTGEKPSVSYAEIAARLKTSDAALRKEVQRLRQRYTELLREEISRTVGGPEEVEDELRHLFAIVSA